MGIPFIMHYRTQLEFRASFDANDTSPGIPAISLDFPRNVGEKCERFLGTISP